MKIALQSSLRTNKQLQKTVTGLKAGMVEVNVGIPRRENPFLLMESKNPILARVVLLAGLMWNSLPM